MRNICANQYQQEQADLMRQYEVDRDRAEQVTEACHRCDRVSELEECPFCSKPYCVKCQESHDCTTQQLIDGRMNETIWRGLK